MAEATPGTANGGKTRNAEVIPDVVNGGEAKIDHLWTEAKNK